MVGGTGDGAAGIFLAGGGRVVIGPKGSVGALSGIAILAASDNVVDGQTLPRKLLVHLPPGGRPVSDLLDGTTENDDGETVFAVNTAILFDSTTGPTGLWAPNGARDVTLVDGFTGLDFSSPAAFVDRHAPRAAVYEALSGFLLRLDGRAGAAGERMRSAETPVWIRLEGGTGSYEAKRATAPPWALEARGRGGRAIGHRDHHTVR